MSLAASPSAKPEEVQQDFSIKLFTLLCRVQIAREARGSSAEDEDAIRAEAKALVRDNSLFGAYALLVSRGFLERDRELAQALSDDLAAARKPMDERVADPSNSELDTAERKQELALMLLQRCALADASAVFDTIGLRTLPIDSQVGLRLAFMRVAILHGRFDQFRQHLLASLEKLPSLGYENRTSVRVYTGIGLLLGAVTVDDLEGRGVHGAPVRAFDFTARDSDEEGPGGEGGSAPAASRAHRAMAMPAADPLSAAPGFIARAAVDLSSAIATYASEAFMSYADFVRVCFAVSLSCAPRREFALLQELSTEANSIVAAEPALTLCIRCLQGCEYSLFSEALVALSDFCFQNPFLHRASAVITREFRVRVFTQYLSAFRSASISRMAASLSLPEATVKPELEKLIRDGRLGAMIDAVTGTVFLRDQNSLDRLADEFKDTLGVLTREIEQTAKMAI